MSPTVVYGRVVVIKRNGADGSVFPMIDRKCVIGRCVDCDIRIQVTSASQRHCSLDVSGADQVSLTNLSATNPVLLNREVLANKALLRSGDIITVGDRSFRWEKVASPRNGRRTPGTPAFKAVEKPSSSLRVSFGPYLSPETFDDTLPVSTPLKKGGRPVTPEIPTPVVLANRSGKPPTTVPEESPGTTSVLSPSPVGSAGKLARRSHRLVQSASGKKRKDVRRASLGNGVGTTKIVSPLHPDKKKTAALRTIHASQLKLHRLASDAKKSQPDKRTSIHVVTPNKYDSSPRVDASSVEFVDTSSTAKTPRFGSPDASDFSFATPDVTTDIFVSPLDVDESPPARKRSSRQASVDSDGVKETPNASHADVETHETSAPPSAKNVKTSAKARRNGKEVRTSRRLGRAIESRSTSRKSTSYDGVEGVKRLFCHPRTPISGYEDLSGVEELMRTPKSAKTPTPVYADVEGIEKTESDRSIAVNVEDRKRKKSDVASENRNVENKSKISRRDSSPVAVKKKRTEPRSPDYTDVEGVRALFEGVSPVGDGNVGRMTKSKSPEEKMLAKSPETTSPCSVHVLELPVTRRSGGTPLSSAKKDVKKSIETRTPDRDDLEGVEMLFRDEKPTSDTGTRYSSRISSNETGDGMEVMGARKRSPGAASGNAGSEKKKSIPSSPRRSSPVATDDVTSNATRTPDYTDVEGVKTLFDDQSLVGVDGEEIPSKSSESPVENESVTSPKTTPWSVVTRGSSNGTRGSSGTARTAAQKWRKPAKTRTPDYTDVEGISVIFDSEKTTYDRDAKSSSRTPLNQTADVVDDEVGKSNTSNVSLSNKDGKKMKREPSPRVDALKKLTKPRTPDYTDVDGVKMLFEGQAPVGESSAETMLRSKKSPRTTRSCFVRIQNLSGTGGNGGTPRPMAEKKRRRSIRTGTPDHGDGTGSEVSVRDQESTATSKRRSKTIELEDDTVLIDETRQANLATEIGKADNVEIGRSHKSQNASSGKRRLEPNASPLADYTNVAGLKSLFKSPKNFYSPRLSGVSGLFCTTTPYGVKITPSPKKLSLSNVKSASPMVSGGLVTPPEVGRRTTRSTTVTSSARQRSVRSKRIEERSQLDVGREAEKVEELEVKKSEVEAASSTPKKRVGRPRKLVIGVTKPMGERGGYESGFKSMSPLLSSMPEDSPRRENTDTTTDGTNVSIERASEGSLAEDTLPVGGKHEDVKDSKMASTVAVRVTRRGAAASKAKLDMVKVEINEVQGSRSVRNTRSSRKDRGTSPKTKEEAEVSDIGRSRRGRGNSVRVKEEAKEITISQASPIASATRTRGSRRGPENSSKAKSDALQSPTNDTDRVSTKRGRKVTSGKVTGVKKAKVSPPSLAVRKARNLTPIQEISSEADKSSHKKVRRKRVSATLSILSARTLRSITRKKV